MGTLMEDLQDRIEDAVNSTGTFDESLQKLADLYGEPAGSNPARLISVAAEFEPSITSAPAALNYLLNNPSKLPTLGLDFISKNTLDSRITFTRASTATYFNSAGVLTSAGNNVARFDYNPTTLAARGLLIEEQRTNSIRNNTMQGAVAGSPGTSPTNWTTRGNGLGYTQTIVEVGTESGINYIDIRLVGTTGGTLTNAVFARPDGNTQVAASSGQTWTGSQYVRLVGGSLANVTINTAVVGYDVAGTALEGSRTAITPTSASLASQRYSQTRTLTNASTAYVMGLVEITFASGVALDITLRIGLPQLEQGAFATSVIPTTTTALTRNADVASVNTLSPWYIQNDGTFFAEFIPGVSIASPERGIVSIDSAFARGHYFHLSTTLSARSRDASTTANTTGASFTVGNITKVAGVLAQDLRNISTNGGAVISNSTVLSVPTNTQMLLGDQQIQGSAPRQLNGWLRRITYYPRRLSNAELQAITA